MKRIALYDEDVSSQASIMPDYTYQPPVNTDFSNYWWMPTQQYRPDLTIGDVPNYVNLQTGISNIGNAPIPTCLSEKQSETGWPFVGNQQSVNAMNQGVSSNSLPEQVWPPPHHPPNSKVSAVRVDLMNVEQTAAWIRTLSLFNGWEEADQYYLSFQKNGIWGQLLWKLTLESLKSDLGITKYGHRLEIKVAITRLYPGLQGQEVPLDTNVMIQNRSPMSETLSETESDKLSSYPVPTLTSSTPNMYKPTQRDLVFPSGELPSSRSGTAGVSSLGGSLIQDNENKKVLKNIDKPMNSQTSTENLPAMNFSKTVQWHTPKETPTEVLSFSVRRKSTRARPDNPIKYKTLRNAKIRSGKSVRTDGVGYLQKGAVVVINQIKGRSGRVVRPQHNGEFMKVGWVTLYTHDRQQLLEKVNPKRTVLRTKA